jgi:hypothetical protein
MTGGVKKLEYRLSYLNSKKFPPYSQVYAQDFVDPSFPLAAIFCENAFAITMQH